MLKQKNLFSFSQSVDVDQNLLLSPLCLMVDEECDERRKESEEERN